VLGNLLVLVGPHGQGSPECLQRSMLHHCRNLARADMMPVFVGTVRWR
jgi:hypothetical protein